MKGRGFVSVAIFSRWLLAAFSHSQEVIPEPEKYQGGHHCRCGGHGPLHCADLCNKWLPGGDYRHRELVDRKAYGVKSGEGACDYGPGRDRHVMAERDAKFIKIAECLYKKQRHGMQSQAPVPGTVPRRAGDLPQTTLDLS